MGKNENNFSKTIAFYDLKVGTCIELNDLLNLHEYQRSSHSLTFPKGYWVFKVKSFFSETVELFETKYFICERIWEYRNENLYKWAWS